jgi:hypothetical protein
MPLKLMVLVIGYSVEKIINSILYEPKAAGVSNHFINNPG